MSHKIFFKLRFESLWVQKKFTPGLQKLKKPTTPTPNPNNAAHLLARNVGFSFSLIDQVFCS